MEAPKIHLSPTETELMKNAGIILTKNRVLEKIKGLLEEVLQQQAELVSAFELTTPFTVPAKISRGENYLGLPWLILDYPRVSAGGDLFFIRSLFWWGNFFSSTLHLAGKHKEEQEQKIAAAYKILGNYYIGVNEDPWSHHFKEDNYKRIGSFTGREFGELCQNTDHLKIAVYWPLAEWQEASSRLYENWKFFLELTGQLPRR